MVNGFACTFDDIHGFLRWEMPLYQTNGCVHSVIFTKQENESIKKREKKSHNYKIYSRKVIPKNHQHPGLMGKSHTFEIS